MLLGVHLGAALMNMKETADWFTALPKHGVVPALISKGLYAPSSRLGKGLRNERKRKRSMRQETPITRPTATTGPLVT